MKKVQMNVVHLPSGLAHPLPRNPSILSWRDVSAAAADLVAIT